MRAAAFLLTCAIASAQTAGTWQDPSPHKAQFVTVEDGVQLEVLDWGGTGRPIVLLAGYLTAHAYDDFAPTLTPLGHVYGITRRGLGVSSRPEAGYDAERSAEDVIKVLDALKLDAKPILLGHSWGGQDLSTIGALHSERVAALVYLNSAEDPKLGLADYGAKPPDARHLPAATRAQSKPDLSSFQAYRDWQLRVHGVAFPESELRQSFTANPDGSMGKYLLPQVVRNAVLNGARKPEYARIRVPVLAFTVAPTTIEQLVEKYKPNGDEELAALKQKCAFDLAIHNRHLGDLKAGVPTARVIEVPGANFYIFLSNGPEIVRQLRAFIGESVR